MATLRQSYKTKYSSSCAAQGARSEGGRRRQQGVGGDGRGSEHIPSFPPFFQCNGGGAADEREDGAQGAVTATVGQRVHPVIPITVAA